MDLPAELRIMIAKYVLYSPEGLWWIWLRYSTTYRVATLIERNSFTTLDMVNALARTCRTLYQETRGIVLDVNTIVFDINWMHCRVLKLLPPPQQNDETETVNVLYRSSTTRWWPEVRQVEIRCFNVDLLISDTRTKLEEISCALNIRELSIISKHWGPQLRYYPGLYTDAQLQEPEFEKGIRRNKLLEFITAGKEVIEKLDQVSASEKRWRIFPDPSYEQGFKDFVQFATEDQLKLVNNWFAHGVGYTPRPRRRRTRYQATFAS